MRTPHFATALPRFLHKRASPTPLALRPRSLLSSFPAATPSFYSTAPAATVKPIMTTPRPSSSLLLLSRLNRVLLLQRTATLTFPSMHVFPGGVLSAQDPTPLHTALRETFEETGLLLTRQAPPSHISLPEAREAVHNNKISFLDFVASFGGELISEERGEAVLFTTWITPPVVKKRFRTQMWLACTPGWVEETMGLGGDGGAEVVVGSSKWWEPREAMEAGIALMPPQFWLLSEVEREVKEGGRDKLWKRAREVGGAVVKPTPGKGPAGEMYVKLVGLDGLAVEVKKTEQGVMTAVGIRTLDEAGEPKL